MTNITRALRNSSLTFYHLRSIAHLPLPTTLFHRQLEWFHLATITVTLGSIDELVYEFL